MFTCHQRAVMGLICVGLSLFGLSTVKAQTAASSAKKKTTAPRTAIPADAEDRPTRPTARIQRTNGEGNADAAEERRPRPEAQPLRVQVVSPELAKVLKDWENKSAQVLKLEGDFEKYTYDFTFEVEQRAHGSFVFEAPDKGVYLVKGTVPTEKEKSRRLSAAGNPFQLKPGESEHWVCDGIEILNINHAAKSYEKIQIPETDRGKNIVNGPLPFLFGMKAEQAKRRYEMKLKKQSNTSEIWISAVPLWGQDRQNYQEAVVILDAEEFLPIAVKLVDSAGTKEIVHKFGPMKVNAGGILKTFTGNPFKPNVKGYKLVQIGADPPPAALKGTPQGRPAGSGVQPAGGVQPRKPAVNNASSVPRTKKS